MSILTGDILLYSIAIIVGIITLIIVYWKRSFQFWKNRGVSYFEPSLIWGNFDPPYNKTVAIGDEVANLYNKAKENGWKQLGFYNLNQPTYMAIDLDIIKRILTKDFNHFVDRGFFVNEKVEPITAHLFAIGGKKWRRLRTKFTPTFTSGKMRVMFKTLTDCGDQLNKYLTEEVSRNKPIDIKDMLGNFSTNIIGSCAFGLDCNTFEDPDNQFKEMGKKFFTQTLIGNLKFLLASIFPKIVEFLKIRVLDPMISEFFTKVVADTVNYREKNKVIRNDFLQLLIDIKNNKDPTQQAGDGSTLTLNEMVAQSFVFFIAGFETSSTTMTFALYELARNPDVQQKVRDEINHVLKKYNGEVTYDALNELKYMSQVIDETLRLFPPVQFITRKCVEDYTIPETNLELKEGTGVWISIKGIHYDEEYYPNPLVFDPDRFSEENKRDRNNFAHIPFGEGPRICIGMRFGIMQTKVGLVNVIKNFKVSVNKMTKTPLEVDVNSTVPQAKGGVWLDMEKIV